MVRVTVHARLLSATLTSASSSGAAAWCGRTSSCGSSSRGGKACVALAADLLLAVVLLRKVGKRGVDGTATQAEHEVERRLLLDVVVRGAAVLPLLAREDEALLIRRDALLVLDLLLHVLDRVASLHVKRDGLARKGLHEDLHLVCGESVRGRWPAPRRTVSEMRDKGRRTQLRTLAGFHSQLHQACGKCRRRGALPHQRRRHAGEDGHVPGLLSSHSL